MSTKTGIEEDLDVGASKETILDSLNVDQLQEILRYLSPKNVDNLSVANQSINERLRKLIDYRKEDYIDGVNTYFQTQLLDPMSKTILLYGIGLSILSKAIALSIFHSDNTDTISSPISYECNYRCRYEVNEETYYKYHHILTISSKGLVRIRRLDKNFKDYINKEYFPPRLVAKHSQIVKDISTAIRGTLTQRNTMRATEGYSYDICSMNEGYDIDTLEVNESATDLTKVLHKQILIELAWHLGKLFVLDVITNFELNDFFNKGAIIVDNGFEHEPDDEEISPTMNGSVFRVERAVQEKRKSEILKLTEIESRVCSDLLDTLEATLQEEQGRQSTQQPRLQMQRHNILQYANWRELMMRHNETTFMQDILTASNTYRHGSDNKEGGSKRHIAKSRVVLRTNGKQYSVRVDKKGRYILVNKSKTYLSDIKGKYKYT